MTQTDPPLQALTIFLLRDGVDPTKALKAASRLQRIEIDQNHTLFIKRTKARPPTWTRFFANRVDPEHFGRVKSAAAVLICASASRHFAVVFGAGRYLLDLQAIEQRFGLLTTLNSVDPRKVRSIDKSSLDRQGMQSRIQASRDASAKDFGLDIEQDLVRAVAGIPIDGLLGETIAGFDSLHVSTRIEFSELRQRLAVYLAKSQQTLYRREFGWIDHIREVRDARTLDDLNRELIKEIKSGSPNTCWMAPDGIIDWNQIAYFQFGSAQGAPRFSNLALERFIEHLGGPKKLTPDAIERTRVRALDANDLPLHEWPAARCLQAELPFGQRSYLLSSGKWYQVDEDFVASVDSIVRTIPSCSLGLPEYEDAKEGVYNKRAAGLSRSHLACLDADNDVRGRQPTQFHLEYPLFTSDFFDSVDVLGRP